MYMYEGASIITRFGLQTMTLSVDVYVNITTMAHRMSKWNVTLPVDWQNSMVHIKIKACIAC